MAWLRAVVDLTFLVLALILITTLLANRYDGAGYNAVHVEIQNVKKDVLDVHLKNVLYLENRVNRVTESSDSYQVSVNGRISVLENRMVGLEARSKENTRIVNNNSAVANGLPTALQVASQELE
jgi:hypothetical protein